MKESIEYKQAGAARRARRVRAKVRGTAARPRLSVALSRKRMFAQCIDDQAGKTLAAAYDMIVGGAVSHVTASRAVEFGRKFAQLAKDKGIERVVFDRGARTYHGRVKAFAEGAREAGLKF